MNEYDKLHSIFIGGNIEEERNNKGNKNVFENGGMSNNILS